MYSSPLVLGHQSSYQSWSTLHSPALASSILAIITAEELTVTGRLLRLLALETKNICVKNGHILISKPELPRSMIGNNGFIIPYYRPCHN